jgi:hypothetical protein
MNSAKLRRLALWALLGTAAALPACSASSDDETEESEDPLASSSLSLTSVRSVKTYEALSTDGGGFGQAGRSMKFLIDSRDAKKRQINFINGNYKVGGTVPDYAKYHYYFAQKKLGITTDNTSFNDNTYFEQDKHFFAGTIQTYLIGEATTPTYAVQFYPDDVIAEETLVTALTEIKKGFSIRGAKMAFVATGPQQTTARVGAQIAALGFDITSIDKILGSVKYLPMNPGEAWGYIRMFPKDVNELRPTDIPVFDELPLDLSVVAGTLTKTYQDATSHVNLKAKERGTPNMVLRDASLTNTHLAPFIDKPVHLVVGKKDFTIEATTDAVVQAKLQARLSKPWIALPVVGETRLLSYDEMCPTLNPACLELTPKFGGKATGLGFLTNRSVLGRYATTGTVSRKMGYDLVPGGFGVPVQGYRDFIELPANAALKAKVEALIAKEKTGNLSPNERVTLINEVQGMFYTATVPPAALAALKARIAELVPATVEEIKVRSSSNAEDVPNFDGAGLYDSFSAEPAKTDNPDFSCRVERETGPGGVVTKSKVKPKTVQCAVKAVYASLWNRRGIEERSFARLDHSTSGMGLAIVPAYDSEEDVVANAVIISRVVNGDGLLGYTVSVQKGNNLVTNPDPGTIAQTSIATFAAENRPARFTVQRYATPEAGKPALTDVVLPEAKMQEMVEAVKAVEIAYCKAKPGYYPNDCRYVWLDDQKPQALDLEIKILANGHLVVKQAREFHGH